MSTSRQAGAEIYIGLMSGTSLDSVDAVAVTFHGRHLTIIGQRSHPLPKNLKKDILKLCQPGEDTLQLYAETDVKLGELFAEATLLLLAAEGLPRGAITAIGSHGQTVRHAPPDQNTIAFSQQIGDPNVIATRTGCPTVADFRRADIALGGQGAPLVPAFHEDFFSDADSHRVIINIGGIANITSLPPSHPCSGFDTGPGNLLMDAWCLEHRNEPYDHNGDWGAEGAVNSGLLQHLKKHPFFALATPKSTGRESFNLGWLNRQLAKYSQPNQLAAEDIQATLCALTADSIADSIRTLESAADEAYVCGGGAHNRTLMAYLKQQLKGLPLATTATLGLHPDWVEAVAFAWLAMRRIHRLPGNLPNVTGARRHAILGGFYTV